jgi:ADP-ribose pyrophosphatase YjhB (NUDIX family)
VEESRAYPGRPWVGVGVVVWRGDDVLLVQRGRPPRQGEWGIPGGAQTLGETVFETAVREVFEETGLLIRPTAIVTAVDSIWRDESGAVEYHYTIIEVLAEWIEGEAIPASDIDGARWVRPEDAAQYVRWEATLAVIEQARQMRMSLPGG